MKVAFHTLGCKVNFYETDKMCERFKHNGFEVVDFNQEADVYVINTCSVTNMADRKSRKMIHRVKRTNPNALCVAVGCYVQAAGEKLLEDTSIDMLIDNEHKEEAVHMVMERLGLTEIENTLDTHIHQSERTRAYIKVQDGCNQFCTYCLIPYMRGKLKSRTIEDVVDEVKGLAKNHYHEVVLTGIHLSSYGVNKSDKASFVELKGRPLLKLIRQVSAIEGIERVRLGSLEPRIITEEFLEGLSGIAQVCPHFHLSLQSGSDTVLARMNRKYTAAQYAKTCELIRNYFEHPAITTDIITGFPGETETEWNETMKFAEAIGFADIHVFKYSPREGTKAAIMEEQVDDQIKTKRSDELIGLAKKMTVEYQKAFIGKKQKVLMEECQTVDEVEYVVGHNERYVKFGIAGANKDLINEWIEVLPIKSEGNNGFLFGNLIKNS